MDARPGTFPTLEEIDCCLARDPDIVKNKLLEYEREAEREAAKRRERRDQQQQSPGRGIFGFWRKGSKPSGGQAAGAADLMSEEDTDYTGSASGPGDLSGLTEEMELTMAAQSVRDDSLQVMHQRQTDSASSQVPAVSRDQPSAERILHLEQSLTQLRRQMQDMETLMKTVAARTQQATTQIRGILEKETADRQAADQRVASEAVQFCAHNTEILEERMTETEGRLYSLIGRKISEKSQSSDQTQAKIPVTPAGSRIPIQRTRSRSSPAAVRQVLFADDGPKDQLKQLKLLTSLKDQLPKYGGEEHEDFDMFERDLKQCLMLYPIPDDQARHLSPSLLHRRKSCPVLVQELDLSPVSGR